MKFVISTLLFGAKIWAAKKQQVKIFDVAETRTLSMDVRGLAYKFREEQQRKAEEELVGQRESSPRGDYNVLRICFQKIPDYSEFFFPPENLQKIALNQ